MRSMLQLQQEWLQLRDNLGDSFDRQQLAAPFVSLSGDETSNAARRPILLVGKATAGLWGKVQYDLAKHRPIAERLAERRSATQGQIESIDKGDRNPSAFWRFRRGLEQISKPVLWTNLAKIGAEKGNPKWRLLKKQSDLACETLSLEIHEYRPALIVLVTHHFGRDEVVSKLFGNERVWEADIKANCRWQQQATSFGVPVLWTAHPERKNWERLRGWLDKARELYATSGE